MTEENSTTTSLDESGAFMSSLTRNNKEIRKDRAISIGEDAEMRYKRCIEDLDMDIKRLKRDQENMLDLSPTNAMSLKLASDFDADVFVSKDREIALKIRNKTIEVNLAKARYNYLFGDTYKFEEEK